MSTLGRSAPDRRRPQSSAAADGPMIRTCPPERYSTLGTGSGSGSAAMASNAAILGVAAPPSADQPACSRRFTNLILALEPSASSLNSGASWVHATTTSGSPSASRKAPACLRHSSVWILSGVADLSAAPSARASIGTVPLQLQSLSMLFCIVRVIHFSELRILRRFFLFLGLRSEKRAPGVLQLRQHAGRDRVLLAVVVDVDVQAVHDVEARIAEELLQCHAPHALVDLGVHERLEVRVEAQAVVVDVDAQAVDDVEARIAEELLQCHAPHALVDLGVHERLEVRVEAQA